MQCNYNSFIQIINFHGLFRNALRCQNGACRILMPLRYVFFKIFHQMTGSLYNDESSLLDAQTVPKTKSTNTDNPDADNEEGEAEEEDHSTSKAYPFGVPFPGDVPADSKASGLDLPPRVMVRTTAFWILWLTFLVNGQGIMFISTLYKVSIRVGLDYSPSRVCDIGIIMMIFMMMMMIIIIIICSVYNCRAGSTPLTQGAYRDDVILLYTKLNAKGLSSSSSLLL